MSSEMLPQPQRSRPKKCDGQPKLNYDGEHTTSQLGVNPKRNIYLSSFIWQNVFGESCSFQIRRSIITFVRPILWVHREASPLRQKNHCLVFRRFGICYWSTSFVNKLHPSFTVIPEIICITLDNSTKFMHQFGRLCITLNDSALFGQLAITLDSYC